MRDLDTDRFVRNHLKIKHLVLMVELGRHGSILRAANASHMTQPAASKLLAELEYVLGVQLFERLARGISPTWYGEVMIRRAGAALAEMSIAHQEIKELLSGLHGRVSIGTVITPSTGLVPSAVQLLKTNHGRVNVAIIVDTSPRLLQQLRSGQLDMVIGRLVDGEMSLELNFEPLNDEPHSLLARAGHPLANRRDLSMQDLGMEAWILPPAGSIVRDRLTGLFLSKGVAMPLETVETLSIPVISKLLMDSDMLAALPKESVQTHLDSGLLVEIPFDLGLRMDIYGIITRKQHELSPSAAAMLSALREIAANRKK